MKQLGKYEILEPLGGGLGSVYRARDTMLDREVALKTIVTGSDVSPEVKERFYREARACARLQHPHIVTIYDLREQDGVAYIVMELLTGADLQRIIAEKRPMAPATRVELAAQVAEALAYAHRQGIVHRDIKPANVFIQEQGAKILDFGVARVASSQLTRIGSALGTPDYMAPEQIAGQVCDSRSDLFSAAIVFFEFFGYSHPFAGRNVPRRILSEPPGLLRSVSPALPPSLEGVLARGLEKDPNRRFQSGDEFAGALRAVAPEMSSVEQPKAPALPPPDSRPLVFALKDPILDALRLRARQLLDKDPDSCLAFIRSLGPKQQADGEVQRLRWEAEARQAAGTAVAPASAAAEPLTDHKSMLVEVQPVPVEPALVEPVPVQPVLAQRVAVEADPVRPSDLQPAAVEAAPPAAAEAPLSYGPAPRLQPLLRPVDPSPPLPSPRLRPASLLPAQKRIVAACAIVVLAASAAIALQLRSRTGGAVPAAVGAAQVISDQATLLREPRAGAAVAATLKKGDAVRLVRLPSSRDEPWAQVQPLGDRRIAAAYGRVADLGEWSSEEPETALQLLKLFAPADSAPEVECETYLERLKSFSSRFGITAQGPAANLERARVHLLLAQRMQQAERPPSDWQPHLDDATGQLAMASAETALESQVSQAREELERLKDWEPPPPPRPVRGARGGQRRR